VSPPRGKITDERTKIMKMPCDVKRYWFEYDDGTFYRNCPLIMREQEKAGRLGLFRLADKLHQEFWETFRRGVQYKKPSGTAKSAFPPQGHRSVSCFLTWPGVFPQTS
jgi:hypothetical protein